MFPRSGSESRRPPYGSSPPDRRCRYRARLTPAHPPPPRTGGLMSRILAFRSHALSFPLALMTIAVCLAAATPAGAQRPVSGLLDYPRESDLLVQVPGSANSVAAGLFNPASWALRRPGMFASWDDTLATDMPKNFAGVLSLKNAAFGMRRFNFLEPDGGATHVTDYTLGLAGGSPAGGVGISYAWAGGRHDLHPRDERLTLGA